MHWQIWSRHDDPLWTHPRRGAPVDQRFWLNVDCSSSPDGCWPWTGYTGGRYGLFSIGSRAAGTFKPIGAHVFALEQGLGRPLAPGMQALHICDNPACVRNDDEGIYEINGVQRLRRGHLWEGTNQDNVDDKMAKGRGAVGECNRGFAHPERQRGVFRYNAAFVDDDIRSIRSRVSRGERQSDLAIEYGINAGTISKIIRRETWRHVD